MVKEMIDETTRRRIADAIREQLPSFSMGHNDSADPFNAQYADAIALACADAALTAIPLGHEVSQKEAINTVGNHWDLRPTSRHWSDIADVIDALQAAGYRIVKGRA